MSKATLLNVIWIILIAISAQASITAKITDLSGDVKIRRGVEEHWQSAKTGIRLEEIDTILTEDDAWAELEIGQGKIFKLGSNALLDIWDLREITEKELFLYLMSKKVNTIEQRNGKTPIRIGNVSIVHGDSKANLDTTGEDELKADWWVPEVNTAKYLYDQEYYPNTIIKLHKVIEKDIPTEDCGEIQFYLGKSFDILDKPGQAIDAYEEVVKQVNEKSCEDSQTKKRADEAKKSIEELKHNIQGE